MEREGGKYGYRLNAVVSACLDGLTVYPAVRHHVLETRVGDKRAGWIGKTHIFRLPENIGFAKLTKLFEFMDI